jgi:hypothetical protein
MVNYYRALLGKENVIINVYDNGSTDDTVVVAKNLGCNVFPLESKYLNFKLTDSWRLTSKHNLPIEGYDWNTLIKGELRDDLLQSFKNNIWKNSKADYVIVIDVDEFINIPKDVGICSILQCEGWDMIGDGVQNPDEITEGVRNGYYDKCCVFSPKDISEINYGIGGHLCDPIGNMIFYNEKVKMFHMKYLSEEYALKNFSSIKNSLSSINLKIGWSRHYLVEGEEVSKKYKQLFQEKIKVR